MKCTRPHTQNYGQENAYQHPCGYCPACQHNDRVQWTFRVHQESREAKEQWFITLTYDQDSIPVLGTEDGELLRGVFNMRSNSRGTLLPSDIETFMNSLRKAQEREYKTYIKATRSPAEVLLEPEIRYYMVGEYGELGRPHYHLIIFNLWSNLAQETRLEKIWKKGRIETEPLSSALIHYATGYLHQKNKYIKGEQIKPFMRCSKQLGRRYEKEAKEFHIKNKVPFVHYQGHKIPLPKYYIRRWFKDQDLEEMQKKIAEYILKLDEFEFEPRKKNPTVPRQTERQWQKEYQINYQTKKRKL